MTIAFEPGPLPGCFELRSRVFVDARGRFAKTIHAGLFAAHGLRTDFVEQYYSVSARGVVRGLHLQLPPHEHAKLVYCPSGEVLDVVVDLRRGSPTFGRHVLVTLSAQRGNALYVPAGVAHGFLATSAETLMVYNTTSVHAPEHDGGIRWDSAGVPWPLEREPVVSERDARLAALADFVTPFVFTNPG